jgi:hypothetical protein
MDANTIIRIKPELTRFPHQFDDCFGKITTRRYLDIYVEGQLGDLPLWDSLSARAIPDPSAGSGGTLRLRTPPPIAEIPPPLRNRLTLRACFLFLVIGG